MRISTGAFLLSLCLAAAPALAQADAPAGAEAPGERPGAAGSAVEAAAAGDGGAAALAAETASAADAAAPGAASRPPDPPAKDGAIQAFRASWGVLIVPVMDPASVSQVANPALVFDLGASIRIPLDAAPAVSFDPSADVYWAYYELSPEGRPWPTTVEERTAFVIGALVDFPVFYRAPPLGPFGFEVGAGLCFHLRYGFSAAADAPAADVAAINAYFWDKGRFFMPSAAIRAEYRLTERVAFGFSARALWPVFNYWAGEGMSPIDQGILAAGILVRYGLR